jgi:Skp family chaperone for outer membrane proteins
MTDDSHLHPFERLRARQRRMSAARAEKLFGPQSDHLQRSQNELQAELAAKHEREAKDKRLREKASLNKQPPPARPVIKGRTFKGFRRTQTQTERKN